jgi:hypothetical protein
VKARRRQRRTVVKENEMKASKINLSTRGYFTWSENEMKDVSRPKIIQCYYILKGLRFFVLRLLAVGGTTK